MSDQKVSTNDTPLSAEERQLLAGGMHAPPSEIELRRLISQDCEWYADACARVTKAHKDAAAAWLVGDHKAIQVAQIASREALDGMHMAAVSADHHKRQWAAEFSLELKLAT